MEWDKIRSLGENCGMEWKIGIGWPWSWWYTRRRSAKKQVIWAQITSFVWVIVF
jgi:hypothetical protein